MRAAINKAVVTVIRDRGSKRARSEANFWGMLRDELNAAAIGERWTLTRPHKNNLTGMPFALKRGRDDEEMVIDCDYATRLPHVQYNAGEAVQLSRFFVKV